MIYEREKKTWGIDERLREFRGMSKVSRPLFVVYLFFSFKNSMPCFNFLLVSKRTWKNSSPFLLQVRGASPHNFIKKYTTIYFFFCLLIFILLLGLDFLGLVEFIVSIIMWAPFFSNKLIWISLYLSVNHQIIIIQNIYLINN